MSIRLSLDSSTLTNQSSNDYTISFNNTMLLEKPNDGRLWSVAVAQVTCWYSFYNIQVGVNDSLKYYNSSTWKTVTIPAGIYALSDINTYVKSVITTNGDNPVNVSIQPNYNTLRCEVLLSGSYQLDLQSSVSSLHELLGFDSQILITSSSGESPVDITNGVNKIYVHVSILDDSSYENGASSDVIYSFSPDKAPGSLLDYTPSTLIYYPIRQLNIPYIRVYFTDQRNRPISFNGESCQVVLILRKV
eukprot:Lithocolla_globosa_v1_NODE_1557_length_2488_cov_175.894369.p1 type:complete len:247 gc:universal NODE_1557_length_2488_cov_175.894369:777-1517(+)